MKNILNREKIMASIEKAIDRIKTLQFPTGELGGRVAQILDDCGIASEKDVTIKRDEESDIDTAEAYKVTIPGNPDPCLTILARSGADDYVAWVVDVHQG